MPINYKDYPKNWKTEIRPAILRRAGNCCENCGIRNHSTGYRNQQGIFCPSIGLQQESDMLDGNHIITIVLTIAHLNHDISDNRPKNLKAMCQKCHLDYDRAHHRSTIFQKKTKNMPDLF